MATIARTVLDPERPQDWLDHGYEALFALSWRECLDAQVAAMSKRFAQLGTSVAALDRLAKKEGVTAVDSIEDLLPLLFDHRVYKNYPLSIIEKRDIPKLNGWLDRLTTLDLSKMDLTGLTMIDDWLDRLDEFG